MPHFIAEYTDNIADEVALDRLFESVHRVLGDSGIFPIGGIRSRGVRLTEYRAADGAADYAFVHMQLRIGHGRDVETLRGAGEQLFAAIRAHFEPLMATRYLALSLELVEIHPVLNFKQNNIHQRFRVEKPAA